MRRKKQGFTKKDLEQLKDALETKDVSVVLSGLFGKLESLISRLEAAETLLNYQAIGYPGFDERIYKKYFANWRKASGR